MKNNELLHIDSIAYGGDGVGRLASGKVCFVPGTLPGETVEVAISQDKKSFARGSLIKVIAGESGRIEPACPVFASGICPGCAYLHCSYADELRWKQQQFVSFLTRDELIGNGTILEPFASPVRFGYRNKLKLHSAGNSFAMVGRDNESLIKIEHCLLADRRINDALQNTAVPPCGDEMTWRVTDADGVVAFSGRSCSAKQAWLTETIPGYGIFKVARDGFFQTNPDVGAELVRRVEKIVSEGGFANLTELYCGVGVFSIAAATKNPELHCRAVELNSAAVKAARWNARKHQLADRCEFFAADAASWIKQQSINTSHCLLLDPPRSGLSGNALNNIISVDPGKIIYISCAADTLRRDLAVLNNAGWSIESAGLLDMFPATAHFECMVTLIKR